MELTEMLTRSPSVDDELVFFAMPYGKRTLPNGAEVDFDVLYQQYFAVTVRLMGLRPERADCIPGTMESPLSAAWNGVDRAGTVVIDLSLPSTSVAMELGWAMCLHKRAVVIHHEGAELPTNIVGQVRAIKYRCDMGGLPELQEALRLAIEDARKRGMPEMDLRPRTGVRDVEAIAEVVLTATDHIFVRDIQNELRTGVMRRTDMDYLETLPDDMSKRFRIGARLNGVFVTDENGTRFSQRHGKTNPWPALEAKYRRGTLVRAEVVQINRGGYFVALQDGGKSRIPTHMAEAAGLEQGSEVLVRVLRVDPVRQRIDVVLADHAPTADRRPGQAPVSGTPGARPGPVLPRQGERCTGTVTRPFRERGFVLVTLDGWTELGQPAILHIFQMTPRTRERFSAGELDKGDRLHVEVVSAAPSARDPERAEIRLREVPAEAEPAAEEGAEPERATGGEHISEERTA
ncbi:RNA binding S1 domain protein [Thermomonospora curvata DSM 43183]|uniref:RNA binding S1 domain protein n=1 Tax=Thermomonospora curvata (strain ATCC 19995 / DSM 43183 / JCM 3096 / KCTC 9072 / NBRC 15933 / NCIMB 10081 / Henssen B9) TaxID=471852 RepID=D1AAK9_THECD|nr:RNA binding S1 domain protein [Thermomonospora curvata DSM 43183]PKK14902.1 MAG: hypothetical protein BUE48_007005 [Thermomonospora sp. CIF 1]